MGQSSTEAKNLRAFLVMIQYAEGTFGKDAYRKVFGGGTVSSLNWHPNMPITKGGITSTAAGAYQILGKTWAEISGKLRLTDFGPESQDKAAVELIRRRKALSDVLAGRFGAAITKCRKEWASLPGAGYNQRERSKQSLLAVYKIAGGITTA
ncbi:muramidase [Flaviaesturariibacter aridisoli]|uniref:Muramidase n=2 Tax=Flaviaesturariibacter aridisoli TaxID=2545761 RepID=A0A4R4DWJ7_9BACT|nr:muramidase [Flaviaesturariibacter aridisoli]